MSGQIHDFYIEECLKYQNVAMASEEIMQMINYKYFHSFNLFMGNAKNCNLVADSTLLL